MRCDQCKFWKLQKSSEDIEDNFGDDWLAAAIGFGLCEAVRARWKMQDATFQTHPDSQKKMLEALKQARAYVQDGSEYRAELLTGPDFFCALFAATPTPSHQKKG